MRNKHLKNVDVREYARKKDVFLWEISSRLGYKHPEQFSKLMREELPEEKKNEIIRIIDEIAGSR